MKQIRVFTRDRPGILAEISEALSAAGVNIESIAGESTGTTAVVEIIVDRYNDALRALARTPFRAITEDVLLVKLADRPGALAEIARRFKEAQLNLRSVRTIHREGADSIVAIDAEDPAKARELVKDVLIS